MYHRFTLVIMLTLAAFQAPILAQESSSNTAVGQILDAAKSYGDYKQDERRRERAEERRDRQRDERRRARQEQRRHHPRDCRH